MTTVVTSWGPGGWVCYGQHFLRTFAQHWPANHRLVIYTESQRVFHTRPFVRDLNRVEPCKAFLQRHAAHPETWGRVPQPMWRNKEIEAGYSFRHDAYKFARKVFAIKDAADIAIANGETTLVWIDGDVVTFRDVPLDFIAGLLGKSDTAYLGREGTHSECGFLIFRLPEALPLINRWWSFYETDAFLGERETHDSYLFDRARHESPKVRQNSLTPGGWGSVWERSPLAVYSTHMKGGLKNEPGGAERAIRIGAAK